MSFGASSERRRGASTRRVVATLTLTIGCVLTLVGIGTSQTEGAVHVARIDGEIDLGLAPFLDRTVDEAVTAGAEAVLIEIDTPGGRLDAVLQMRDTLLDSPVHTIAYIDRTALSAGALLALAAHDIYFAPGGVMGAATPVVGTPEGGAQTADPKVVAAVRSTFRATAEERGRDPRIGEAMVDDGIAIDGLSEPGSLVSLSATDAEVVGYSEGVARDRAHLLELAGLDDRSVVEVDPVLAERVVRVITNPLVASILVTVGVLLVVGELVVGAFGLASAAGVALLGTFFYGHLLAGLAGWEDVVLVGIGIVLILVELFVVPGFGVPGVLGMAAVLGGSYLAMIGRDFDFVSTSQMLSTVGTVALAFIAIAVGLIVLLTILGRRRSEDSERRRATARPAPGDVGQRRGWLRWFGDGDVLEREVDDTGSAPLDGAPSAAPPDRPPTESPGAVLPESASRAARRGAVGVALTDLRPAGVAMFDGHRIDVVTEGDYLVAGDPVVILRAERYRRVVRRAPQETVRSE